MKKRICDLRDDEHFIADGMEYVAIPVYTAEGSIRPRCTNRYAVRAKSIKACPPYIMHTHPAYKRLGDPLTVFRTFDMGLIVEVIEDQMSNTQR